MKTDSFKSLPHPPTFKKLPNTVVFAIEGSPFKVKGRVDWSQMTISGFVMTRHAEVGNTFANRVSDETLGELPEELTLAVVNSAGKEEPWEVTLKGLNYTTFEVEDVVVIRNDEKFWYFVMVEETSHDHADYEIVLTEGLGYGAPMARYLPGGLVHIKGRRPIAVEVAGPGGYIGSVTPGLRFNGQWEVLVQADKNITPSLGALETMRVVRFSVGHPDRPDTPENATGFSLYEVDLAPRMIASGRYAEKGMVKNLVYEYRDSFVPDEGQNFIPLGDIVEFADGPGFAALYQWRTFRFAEYLSPELEGTRLEPADFEVDPEVSYGPVIAIHLVQHKNTWTVITKKDPEGKFARDGVAIPAVSCEIDPTLLGEPEKVHRLPSVNRNNKRIVASEERVGLCPVVVYEYDARKVDVESAGFTEYTLCDFAREGCGGEQAALFEWIEHVYGPAFRNLNPLAK